MEHAGAHHEDSWYDAVQSSGPSIDVNLPQGVPMAIGRSLSTTGNRTATRVRARKS